MTTQHTEQSERAESLEDAYEELVAQINHRYHVEKRTSGGFWPYCVLAGEGTMELFVGHKKQCEEVAHRLTSACHDGSFMMKQCAALLSTDAKPVVDGERAELIRNLTAYAQSGESVLAQSLCEQAAAPLAATPAREWVGLTDDEIWKSDEIMAANSGYGANFETLREMVRAIESKLREKNATLSSDAPAGVEAVVCSCAECGKTSTKDSMWALYCLDCIQEHSIGGGFSLRPGYERLIDEYIENYEFTDGGAGYHDPSEFEQAMIKDAFMGFDFSTIYTHPQPAKTAEPPESLL